MEEDIITQKKQTNKETNKETNKKKQKQTVLNFLIVVVVFFLNVTPAITEKRYNASH